MKVCFKNCTGAAALISLMKQAGSSLLKEFYRLPRGGGWGLTFHVRDWNPPGTVFRLNLSRWNCLARLTLLTLLLISILPRRHYCLVLFISLCSFTASKLHFLPSMMYKAIKQKCGLQVGLWLEQLQGAGGQRAALVIRFGW